MGTVEKMKSTMSFACATLAVVMLAHAVTASHASRVGSRAKTVAEINREKLIKARSYSSNTTVASALVGTTYGRTYAKGDDGPNTRFNKKRVAAKELRLSRGDTFEARY